MQKGKRGIDGHCLHLQPTKPGLRDSYNCFAKIANTFCTIRKIVTACTLQVLVRAAKALQNATKLLVKTLATPQKRGILLAALF